MPYADSKMVNRDKDPSHLSSAHLWLATTNETWIKTNFADVITVKKPA